MADATVRSVGVVVERRGEILYEVEMANGKRLLGHLSKEQTHARAAYAPGDRLVLELTPYDFDQGRILGREE